jgi:predicted permease
VAITAYGIATSVLWRSLPFEDSSQLVFVWEEVERDGQRYPSRVTGRRFATWQETPGIFASVSLFASVAFTVNETAQTESIRGVRVSTNYFKTLGIRPLIGRTFLPTDEAGEERVVILSHALWTERFGGRRDVLGQTWRLGGLPYRIIGVMPRGAYPGWPTNPASVTLNEESRQLWVPVTPTAQVTSNDRSHVFGVLARLAPHVDRVGAQDALNRWSTDASTEPHQAWMTPFREQFVRDVRTPLLVLLVAALTVMTVAIGNVAALHLASFEARRGEFAARTALGAGAARLVRQLIVETTLVVIAGACVGTLAAHVILVRVPSFLPASVPLLTPMAVDSLLVIYVALFSMVTVTALTIGPIRRLIRIAPAARGVLARPRTSAFRLLVISQVALTMVLVVVAALLRQTLEWISRRDPGFITDNVLVADIGWPRAHTDAALRVATAESDLTRSLAALPSVVAGAVAYDHPLEANWSEMYVVAGDGASQHTAREAELRIVSPEYFRALGVAVLEGTTFDDRYRLGTPGGVVVNDALAQQIERPVVGRQLRIDAARRAWGVEAPQDFEILGIVEDERFKGLDRSTEPAIYVSTRQFPQQAASLLVRTAGDPLLAAPAVRAAALSGNPGMTISRVTSLRAILEEQLVERRVTSQVIGGFAIAALVLATIGLGGLLALHVASRSSEIGVRLALGATRRRVACQIVGESVRNVGIGVALGSIISILSARISSTLLVGVSPVDPMTLLAVASLLFVVAVGAALVPAVRAAKIDPVQALRA